MTSTLQIIFTVLLFLFWAFTMYGAFLVWREDQKELERARSELGAWRKFHVEREALSQMDRELTDAIENREIVEGVVPDRRRKRLQRAKKQEALRD